MRLRVVSRPFSICLLYTSFKSPIFIITGFVPVFFDNAVFATIANKNGGVRGLAVTTFISGIIQVLGGAIAVAIFGMKEYGGWIGNFDWDTMWPVIGLLMKNLQYVGIAIAVSYTHLDVYKRQTGNRLSERFVHYAGESKGKIRQLNKIFIGAEWV